MWNSPLHMYMYIYIYVYNIKAFFQIMLHGGGPLGPLVSFRRAFTRLALENPTLEPGRGYPGSHVEAKASQKVATKYVVLRTCSMIVKKSPVRWNIMFSWDFFGYVFLFL